MPGMPRKPQTDGTVQTFGDPASDYHDTESLEHDLTAYNTTTRASALRRQPPFAFTEGKYIAESVSSVQKEVDRQPTYHDAHAR